MNMNQELEGDRLEGTTPPQASHSTPPAHPHGFAALSRFVVANGMTAEVKEAFRHRPHLVDGVPGYLRMDVLSPLECAEEIWLLTFWTDAESFASWHHSHLYHDSHQGIPKGL